MDGRALQVMVLYAASPLHNGGLYLLYTMGVCRLTEIDWDLQPLIPHVMNLLPQQCVHGFSGPN